MPDVDFMAENIEFIRDIIKTNNVAVPEYTGLFSPYASVGVCPRCGNTVREYYKTFSCEVRDCGFNIYKDDKFFTSRKKELTAKIISEILNNGRAKVNDLYSERKNLIYDAYIILKDTGGKFVNFEHEKKVLNKSRRYFLYG
jgi:DNA topoisomerase-3